MRRIQLTVVLAGPWFAERRLVIDVVVVHMDHIRAIAIGHIKAGVRRTKCDIGRMESIAAPSAGRMRIFVLGVNARLHRRVTHPNRITLQRQLGKLLERLISGYVQTLFAVFLVYFEPVSAALKLLAERA